MCIHIQEGSDLENKNRMVKGSPTHTYLDSQCEFKFIVAFVSLS